MFNFFDVHTTSNYQNTWFTHIFIVLHRALPCKIPSFIQTSLFKNCCSSALLASSFNWANMNWKSSYLSEQTGYLLVQFISLEILYNEIPTSLWFPLGGGCFILTHMIGSINTINHSRSNRQFLGIVAVLLDLIHLNCFCYAVDLIVHNKIQSNLSTCYEKLKNSRELVLKSKYGYFQLYILLYNFDTTGLEVSSNVEI